MLNAGLLSQRKVLIRLLNLVFSKVLLVSPIITHSYGVETKRNELKELVGMLINELRKQDE